MRIPMMMVALLLGTGAPTFAQVVSPLGGSTNNPQSPPPAAAAPSTPSPAATAPAARTPAPAHRTTRRTLAQRFEAANTTHDGKLTLEQARAGRLVAVTRDFAEIDKEKRGYVTLDQIKAHQTEQRAAHRAARAQKSAAKPAQTE
jgi:hypothetical protein